MAVTDNRIKTWVLRHVEAWAELGRARLELWTSSWRKVLERADSRPVTGSPSVTNGGREEIVDRIQRTVWRVDRFVFGTTCIHRALAGHRMLTRRGVEARIVIGLRNRGELEGHAWLEVGSGADVQRAFVDEDTGYQSVWRR